MYSHLCRISRYIFRTLIVRIIYFVSAMDFWSNIDSNVLHSSPHWLQWWIIRGINFTNWFQYFISSPLPFKEIVHLNVNYVTVLFPFPLVLCPFIPSLPLHTLPNSIIFTLAATEYSFLSFFTYHISQNWSYKFLNYFAGGWIPAHQP